GLLTHDCEGGENSVLSRERATSVAPATSAWKGDEEGPEAYDPWASRQQPLDLRLVRRLAPIRPWVETWCDGGWRRGATAGGPELVERVASPAHPSFLHALVNVALPPAAKCTRCTSESQ